MHGQEMALYNAPVPTLTDTQQDSRCPRQLLSTILRLNHTHCDVLEANLVGLLRVAPGRRAQYENSCSNPIQLQRGTDRLCVLHERL